MYGMVWYGNGMYVWYGMLDEKGTKMNELNKIKRWWLLLGKRGNWSTGRLWASSLLLLPFKKILPIGV